MFMFTSANLRTNMTLRNYSSSFSSIFPQARLRHSRAKHIIKMNPNNSTKLINSPPELLATSNGNSHSLQTSDQFKLNRLTARHSHNKIRISLIHDNCVRRFVLLFRMKFTADIILPETKRSIWRPTPIFEIRIPVKLKCVIVVQIRRNQSWYYMMFAAYWKRLVHRSETNSNSILSSHLQQWKIFAVLINSSHVQCGHMSVVHSNTWYYLTDTSDDHADAAISTFVLVRAVHCLHYRFCCMPKSVHRMTTASFVWS